MGDTERIRIRYTGIVAFASNLVSVAAGVLFSMIAVRRLTLQDFGSWQYIGTLIPYFTIIGAPINVLMTRFISRNIKAARTGLFLSFLISLAAFALWFPVTWFMSSSERVPISMMYFAIAGLSIFAIYFTDSLSAIVTAHKPQLSSYSFALSEVIKIVMAYLLVVQARLGLTGAIVCTVITQYVRFVALLLMGRGYLRDRVDNEEIKRFKRLYWLPFYSMFYGRIQALDVILVTMLLVSTTAVGLWSSALLVGTIIGYSYALSSGLYPSLLRGGGREDIEEALRLTFMLTIPMSIGAMLVPEAVLNVLRPEYIQASATLAVVSVSALLGGLSSVVDTILYGTERADTDEEPKLSKLMRSNLFKIPLIYYVNAIIYIMVFAAVLLFLGPGASPGTVSMIWALTSLCVGTPFLILRFLLSKRAMNYRLPLSDLTKYLACTTLMAVVIKLLIPSREPPKEVNDAILYLLRPVTLGATVYFLSLYAIDGHFRRLAKSLIHRALALFSGMRGTRPETVSND